MSVERFRELLIARLGLQQSAEDLAPLFATRLSQLSLDAASYLDGLNRDDGELRELARRLTVPESYFFRDPDQLRAFAAIALPDRATHGAVRILSAGAASGEEAYSLAILAREAAPAQMVTILGVDINSDAIGRAKRGVYSPWALRQTADAVRNTWFDGEGRDLRVRNDVRTNVAFEQRNLAEPNDDLFTPNRWDIIFCRNMLMYFAPEQARLVLSRFAASLVRGGYLFLGHAESLRGLCDEFVLQHTHETFYYRSGDAPVTTARAGNWYEEVLASSARLAALTTPNVQPAPSSGDLEAIVELVRAERYTQALEAIEALPVTLAPALLLHAAVLVQMGKLGDARSQCQELLVREPNNAAAHYVMALCESDTLLARMHGQRAAALDVGFAMPRLHLGLMAKRAGERQAAAQELEAALSLLEFEDPHRVILFGGGFTKQALIHLCQSELKTLAGVA